MQVSFFLVDSEEVVKIILGKYSEIKKSYQQRLVKKLKDSKKFYDKNVSDIKTRLEKVPNSIEEIQQIKEFTSKQILATFESFEEKYKFDDLIMDIFLENTLASSQEIIELKWRTKLKANQIKREIKEKEKLWEKCKN